MDAAEPSSSTSTEATTNQWTVHIAPSGRTYYYNGVTQESTWERPKELTDLADGSLGGGIGMMIQMGMQNLDAGGNLQVLAGAQLAGAQVQGGAEGQQQAQLQGMPMQGGQMQDGMAFPAPYAQYPAGLHPGMGGFAQYGGAYPGMQPYGFGGQEYQAYGNQGGNDAPGPGPPIQTTESGQGPAGSNLFVFHIPNDMTNRDLYNYFTAYGNVISARIMVEKETGRSRGFGFVSYDNSASAEAAIQRMNGFQIGRKRLKVQHKKEKEDSPRARGRGNWQMRDGKAAPGQGRSGEGDAGEEADGDADGLVSSVAGAVIEDGAEGSADAAKEAAADADADAAAAATATAAADAAVAGINMEALSVSDK